MKNLTSEQRSTKLKQHIIEMPWPTDELARIYAETKIALTLNVPVYAGYQRVNQVPDFNFFSVVELKMLGMHCRLRLILVFFCKDLKYISISTISGVFMKSIFTILYNSMFDTVSCSLLKAEFTSEV